MGKDHHIRDCTVFTPQFFESAKDRIWVVDSEYKFVCGNQVFQNDIIALRGRPLEHGESIFLPGTPEDVVRDWTRSYQRVLLEDSCCSEVLTGAFSHEIKYIEFTFSPVTNDTLGLSGVLVIGRDITAHKQMEKRLARANNLLEFAQKLTRAGGWEWDIASQEMFWTTEVYAMHGLDASTCGLKGQELIDFSLLCYTEPDRIILMEAFVRCCDTGEPYDLELRFEPPEGTPLWVRTIGYAAWEYDKIAVVRGMLMDITRATEKERRLSYSESKYRAIMEQAAEMLYLHDMQGHVIEVNRAAIMRTGYSAEELQRKTVFDIDPDASARSDKEQVWEKICAADQQTFEARHKSKSGEIYPVEITVGKIDIHGEFYILALVKDISLRKKTELELKVREANARAIMEATSDVFILLDRNGIVLDCNEAHAARLMKTRDMLIGKEVYQFLPDDVAESRKALVDEVFESGRPGFLVDTRAGLWNEISVYPVLTQGEQTDHVAVFSRDITEKRLYDIKLQESERKFRTLFENIAEGVFIMDATGQTLDANDAALEMLGISRDELLSERIDSLYWEVVDEDGKVLEPEMQPAFVALRTGEKLLNITVGVSVPGKMELRWLIIDAIPQFSVSENTPAQVYVYMRDISDRKRSEDEIKYSEEQLKVLNATKDKLFSIIAHDLRTPFNGIVGFSELLKHNAPKLDVNEIIQYASLIHISSQNTLNLLDNLLNWARLQQSATSFAPQRLLLYEAVDDSLKLLVQVAQQKNIAILNEVPAEAIVVADAHMLSVLLRNLISNAIKFSHQGCTINVTSWAIADTTHVAVIDQGVGVAKEDQEKLFDVTSSFSTRGTVNESGTGLGLTLCKDIVEKHQGKIWVESTPGKGSTFTFTLPISIPLRRSD